MVIVVGAIEFEDVDLGPPLGSGREAGPAEPRWS